MKINPTIVIIAYNRPQALQRLLNSIASAVFDLGQINLVISIDKSPVYEVLNLAAQFEWNFGPKEIISHDKHLGLKQHVLFCAALSEKFGSVILLEDDLLVSPYFYGYARQARDYYQQDSDIAGISLYNYQVSESGFYSFHAVDDNADVYFMQVASSWGQLFTEKQWKNFEAWFSRNPELAGPAVPDYLKQWGANSWKKHFIHYLVDTSKYFVFPRLSLSTNFEEAGTHAGTKNIFQVALQLQKMEHKFCPLRESGSVYDASFELLPACINKFNTALSLFNYEVDLYGTKPVTANDFDYLLTSKKAQNAVISFSASLTPLEANVLMSLPGKNIGLYKKAGNRFSKGSLQIHNYLDGDDNQKENAISVVIPVIDLNIPDLELTLSSLLGQDIGNTECLIVSNPKNYDQLRHFVTLRGENFRLVRSDDEYDSASLLALGLENIRNGIVSWILPGNLYDLYSFSKARSIFKLHPSISWIAGLDYETTVGITDLKLSSYRLNKHEVYTNLVKGNLKADTQIQFFRKHCLVNFIEKSSSLYDLYFHLVNHYQCFILVDRFGVPSNRMLPDIPVSDVERLRSIYQHFQSQSSRLKRLLIHLLLNAPIIPNRFKKMLRVHLRDLPDVLRFDKDHQTYYLNRY